jgi:hypothetical protein
MHKKYYESSWRNLHNGIINFNSYYKITCMQNIFVTGAWFVQIKLTRKSFALTRQYYYHMNQSKWSQSNVNGGNFHEFCCQSLSTN